MVKITRRHHLVRPSPGPPAGASPSPGGPADQPCTTAQSLEISGLQITAS
ncbi:MAG: hypothetical protein ACLPN6_15810 [Streptosporangiaceae bacterium]